MLWKHCFVALSLSVAGASMAAETIHFDPGTSLNFYTTNSNDGYINGRGIFFEALHDTTIYGAGWFNGFDTATNDRFRMQLFSATADGSNLRVSQLATYEILAGANGDVWVDNLFAAPVSITAGNFYHLEVSSAASFENWFYDWNGPAVEIDGLFSIKDGSQNASLSNLLAPVLRVQADPVPEPATMLALSAGVAVLAARRRRMRA